MNFPREYRTLGIPTWLVVGVGVVMLGGALLLMGQIGPQIFILPAAVMGVFGLLWLVIPVSTVTCTSEGYEFKQQRRLGGGTSAQGRWADVTETEYFEKVVGVGKNRRVENFLRVDAGGNSITIPTTLRFRELIETFNEMTPQLPYVWRKRTMLQGITGLDYEKALRSEVGAPATT